MMREDLRVADGSMTFNTDLVETLEPDNMRAQESVSLRSTIGRMKSLGVQHRKTFPGKTMKAGSRSPAKR
jgi:succinate dehydrogenase / fumarate reductase, flavoprotein subunit